MTTLPDHLVERRQLALVPAVGLRHQLTHPTPKKHCTCAPGTSRGRPAF